MTDPTATPQTPLDTEAPGETVDPTLRACQWAGLRNPGSAPGLATTGAPATVPAPERGSAPATAARRVVSS